MRELEDIRVVDWLNVGIDETGGCKRAMKRAVDKVSECARLEIVSHKLRLIPMEIR